MQYHIRQCSNELCRFRFPAAEDARGQEVCPQCGDGTYVAVGFPPRADFTRPVGEDDAGGDGRPSLEILLDNTRSVYNVGSMFRTADGAGIAKIHLCGITSTPEHPKFAKTALGADGTVAWNYYLNGVDAAEALIKQGYVLWALEETEQSESLFGVGLDGEERPVVVVLGNEVVGVDPEILALCERHLVIPMRGEKKSLNVTIAMGTAVYWLLYGRV